jgi:hypothetical protein
LFPAVEGGVETVFGHAVRGSSRPAGLLDELNDALEAHDAKEYAASPAARPVTTMK